MARRRFTPRPPRILPRSPVRRGGKRGRKTGGGGGLLALFAIGFLAFLASDKSLPSSDGAVSSASVVPAAAISAAPTEQHVRFGLCGRDRHTCIVDGDTIWLNGANLRLQSYDTPEPYNDICGGAAEVALAKRASARLLELLNGNSFTVDAAGQDRYGRTLATIRIDGTDVGDILISEGLARRWPDGPEFWC